MRVVATAGHVDHGKSTLVRALTGMEPDRWAEERRRGMTIDLGYAWTELASGEQLAFVDVPGHQRFIGNMLAGLGPAPAVLLVVAADAGWSRQSAEHLAAVHALRLRHGLLAITRSDLADPGPALAAARERIGRSSLGEVPAVCVSAVTGAGLPELRAALGSLAAGLPEPRQDGRVRLWVDRSFTVRGAGTVVTGTLGAGTVRAGDRLLAGDRPVVVRGLQQLGRDAAEAAAVARVALNLRGAGPAELGRGDVLLTPDAWHHSRALDVRLERFTEHAAGEPAGEPASLPAELMLHLGTATVPVRVRPLGEGHARLSYDRPLPVQVGDRAILRDPGRQAVAAGVLVLDADPPALRRRGAAARRAAELAGLGGRPNLAAEVRRRGAAHRNLLESLGIPTEAGAPGVRTEAGWLIADGTWQAWLAQAPAAVATWAADHPLEPGMPAEALRRAAGIPHRDLLPALIRQAGLVAEEGRVRAPGQAVTLSASEAAVATVERRLAADPFAAPERYELAELRLGRRELAAAERAGRLLRIAEDLVLLPDAPGRAARLLAGLPQPFTLSEARQALGTTRRVAVPLLEYLDAETITERLPDSRRRLR
ncbi:MAG TPA: SelB C-terminal domain-containing protein [Jatrophihabitans sp.]|nr:SelB C-terminal domain-containing protein [Jatrophihabitans sp.]